MFDDYENHHVLSKCDNIILEAKRVILNEELDKIANLTLNELNNSRLSIQTALIQSKDSLNFGSDEFWSDLPNPATNKTLAKKPIAQVESASCNLIIDKLLQIKVDANKRPKLETGANVEVKKYFLQWKKVLEHKKRLLSKIEHKEKLDSFIKTVKKQAKLKKLKKTTNNNETSRAEPAKQNASYKNRYSAQKGIIEQQKLKLEAQKKLIEELKLGIIREDLMKSIDDEKVDLREIFNSSQRLRAKIPLIVENAGDRVKFMVSTQKAPRIVHQMEQRAVERAQNRELILERKRFIEDNRRRMLEEAIEKKRVMEEEEKIMNLEAIKERRRKEVEMQKIRNANKLNYLSRLSKAEVFYRNLLISRCFKKLVGNCKGNKENYSLAVLHYRSKVQIQIWQKWGELVEEKYLVKYQTADGFFYYKTIGKAFKILAKERLDRRHAMQVAEDYYDFRLTCSIFANWNQYTCKTIIQRNKQMQIARKHFKRRSLFHFFHQWRSLPAVLQLERAKEEKKLKWRQKVWEVLPDYKIPNDDL